MTTPDWDLIVVGAGAAGMLAAVRAAEAGRRTLLLEKNRKPGAKILMSGGTRCNLTQATDRAGIVAAFGPPGRFLYSSLAALGPQELIDLFEAEGVATKVEPTGKVFPVSDKALDVQQALLRRVARSGCRLQTECPLTDLQPADAGWRLTAGSSEWRTRDVLLTTGGKSYPGCGTTGDGYRLAAALGHTVTPLRPALTPLTTTAPWIPPLRGIALPDVHVAVRDASGAVLAARRNALLFTHFGLSGPAALDVSRAVSGHPAPQSLTLACDFAPDESAAEIERRVQQGAGRQTLAALLAGWRAAWPRRFVEALLGNAGLAPQQPLAELRKAQRGALVLALKETRIGLSGTLGYEKAEVTAGGIALDEVDSRTMRSRRAAGLLFAGEILDLDGPIGGYNFQAAFSTGWLAGGS